MCFYDQTRFACGDFKWERFAHHCSKEYRTGETCGLKLVSNCYQDNNRSCKLCDKIQAKQRRREAELKRIARWKTEKNRSASIAASQEIIDDLDDDIYKLQCERAEKQRSLR
jgi:hypothetical protein